LGRTSRVSDPARVECPATGGGACRKTSALMERHGIKHLYRGHYFGKNAETKQRLDDMAAISRDVLAGKVKGEPNPRGLTGLNLVITAYGVRINDSENSVK
jgi:hydroxyacylglutathione hydrolase